MLKQQSALSSAKQEVGPTNQHAKCASPQNAQLRFERFKRWLDWLVCIHLQPMLIHQLLPNLGMHQCLCAVMGKSKSSFSHYDLARLFGILCFMRLPFCLRLLYQEHKYFHCFLRFFNGERNWQRVFSVLGSLKCESLWLASYCWL